MEFRIDMHTHPFSMDSEVKSVPDFLRMAKSRRLDAVIATDHHSYGASREMGRYSGFANDCGLRLFRGIEITTDIGHLLAYGVRDDRWQGCSHDGSRYKGRELVKILNGEGAFVAAAHPTARKGILRHMSEEQIALMEEIGALEIFNGVLYASRDAAVEDSYHKICSTRKIGAIGGSDAHTIGQVGSAFTVFSREIRTIEDLVAELRNGMYCPERYKAKECL